MFAFLYKVQVKTTKLVSSLLTVSFRHFVCFYFSSLFVYFLIYITKMVNSSSKLVSFKVSKRRW